jgi:hypothetical protein
MIGISRVLNGFIRAFKDVIVGIAFSALVGVAVRTAFGNSPFVSLIELAMALSAVMILFKMRYWSTKYICGWLLGIGLLAQLGLVTVSDFPLFVGPIAVVFLRNYRRAGSNSR